MLNVVAVAPSTSAQVSPLSVEISHWYETVFAMGLVYMFFVYASPYSHFVAIVVCLLVYFAEVAIDNVFSRVRWQLALKTCWLATLVLGCLNLFLINLFK